MPEPVFDFLVNTIVMLPKIIGIYEPNHWKIDNVPKIVLKYATTNSEGLYHTVGIGNNPIPYSWNQFGFIHFFAMNLFHC